MGLSTRFTELLGVRHPIALAPMGGSAGGALAAAVSRGGGLGMLGSANGDPEWLARELPLIAEAAGKPWGIGFLTWQIDADAIERVLEHRPRAVMLSFGDPRPFAERIRAADTVLIIQVTDLEEARQAVDLGADVIVAQGTESGGHGARQGRSTLPFVPVVVDLAAPVPVLAAGGIADGRGVAAALALGAAGALVGTRFQATTEALVDPSTAKAIVEGQGEDTERNRGARHRPRLPVAVEVHRPDPGPPLPRPVAGQGSRTRRGPQGQAGLPTRPGAGGDPRAADVGRRGGRPHHRPAIRS
ncbi:nitronate monooxygenase [Streptomyces sp. GLT-R25]